MAQIDTFQSLKESVIDRIRRDIVLRILPPGAVVRDSELALRYGVSSSPIREALVHLEAERLIDMSTNRSKRVGVLDRKTTEDFFSVYKLVALAGFSWGATSVSPAHISKMESALAAMEANFADKNRYDIVLLSHQFFFAVYEASGNTELINILSRRLAWVDRLLVLVGKYDREEIILRLREIMDHFVSGNISNAIMVHYHLIHELEAEVKRIDFENIARENA